VVIERIALVSPYALSVFGGVQEQVLAMSRELSLRGRDVIVICPDSSDARLYDTPAEVARFGHLLLLPANGSKAPLTLSFKAARDAREALEAFRPDVVHLHEPFAPLIGWAILRSHRTPQVATFHRSGAGPAFTLTRPLLKSLARDIDVASSVSESAALTIRSTVGVESRVLFNGFETDRFVASPRERGDEIVLVCVGRLEERKGTEFAVHAVLEHNARGGDQWRLVVIGDGPERAKLELLCAHDEMIVFAGAVGDATKRAWLRRADVLLAPATRGESFGLVLLEAMASETLVVASDIPGYREAAGGHAVLFEPANERSLEQAVAKALSGESAEAIAGARRHAERWSMGHLMDEYETIYEIARQRFHEPR
jgi:phosphatidylinositol alpha-mannosyltransferase